MTPGVDARWEPNAPEAVLLSDGAGQGALAQRAQPDDPDQRSVVLRLGGVVDAVITPPNDEARFHHPVYDLGLKDLM